MKKLLNIITDGKYQTFKTIFIVTICTYIAFLTVMTVLLSNTNSDAVMNVYMPLNICLSWALIIEIFYYFIKFSPLKKSIKLATIDGSIEHISEITGKDFESNGRIAFSDHFFYDLKTNFFITYRSIVWVYYKDGGIIIRTINGKKFRTRIDNDNLGALLKANPQIMNGYNSNNYKEYTVRVATFNSHAALNAETRVFDIPNAINNFWQWLSSKTKSKVFYTIGYTCEALFFIGFIVIAIIDSPGNRISNWVSAIWLPLHFIGLFCLYIGHKVEGYEPKTYVAPQKKQFTAKTTKPPVPKVKTFIEKAYLQRLFGIESNDKNAYSTFIALDKRNGKALRVIEHRVAYDNSYIYEVQDITYDDVRKYAKEKDMEEKYKELSSANWKTFLTEEKCEAIKKKCKFCKKDFPAFEIDDKGYCPHCAENWWKY